MSLPGGWTEVDAMANAAATNLRSATAPLRDDVVARGRSATRTVVATFGLVLSMAGLEHGIGEILEGPVAPPDLVFRSWPDTPAFEILGGEPALTIVPNLLVTGVLTVVVSAALPSNASTINGNPRGVGQQPERDLRVQAAFLGVMPMSA